MKKLIRTLYYLMFWVMLFVEDLRAPIRENYADEVIIVTSGEKMSLYAAGNIVKAVKSFETRGYASVKGVILNRRNVEDEEVEVVQIFSRKTNYHYSVISHVII